MFSLGVSVEQFWNKVPGGTGVALSNVLSEFSGSKEMAVNAYAAKHINTESPFLPKNIETNFFILPRPLLYNRWLSGKDYSKDFGDSQVFWSPSMVTPKSDLPTVTTVHDLYFLKNPEVLSPRGKSFFPRAFETAIERSDIIVCPSRFVANDVEKYGGDSSKIKVINWGVHMPRVEPKRKLLDKYSLPPSYVLSVGTAEPRKNLRKAIEAVSLIADTHLVIAGPDGWGADEIDADFNRLSQLGKVPSQDLDALYFYADAFLMPSLEEGFGLPILEAMAHKTPVITSDNSACAETASGCATLCDPTDEYKIAKAIRRVLDDSKLSDELVAAGYERAQELSWSVTAAQYLETFRSLLETK